MSEFIAVCPKCRQQILCDTAYVGKRIACPVCLQEISMPEPPQRTAETAPKPPGPVPGAQGIQKSPVPIVVICAAVVILVVVAATFIVFQKKPAVAAPTPAPVTAPNPTPAVVAVPTPAPPTEPPPAPVVKPEATSPGVPDQPRAIWAFNQDSGSTVIDTTGNGYNGVVVGDNVNWVKSTNAESSGLRLGDSNFVEVAGAVVNTMQSFTVSAWINLDMMASKKYQTFVSIDGSEISGFYLQLNPYAGQGTGRFEFDRYESDSKGATRISAKARPSITTNTWYHLAGVYDADAQSTSLYLDGKLQDTVPFTGPWQARGKTAIGRGRINGHDGNYFNGVIRDVRFYAGALTGDQIKKIAK